MTDIVLVHGALHGSWCWERLVPVLERDPRVRRVVAIDLPGRDRATSTIPVDDITLDDFADHLVAEFDTHGIDDALVVGHSLGGQTLTHSAARLAGRIRRLVYLTAISLPAGTSVMDLMGHPDSQLTRGLTPLDTFCTDFSAAEREWLASRLGDDAPRVMTDPMPTDRPPADVALTYVLCERDAALAPSMQQLQIDHLGIDDVVRLDAGHSPFVTHIDELAGLLLTRA